MPQADGAIPGWDWGLLVSQTLETPVLRNEESSAGVFCAGALPVPFASHNEVGCPTGPPRRARCLFTALLPTDKPGTDGAPST